MVVVVSASEAYSGVTAVGGYVVGLFTFVALLGGGWGPVLLHSILKQIHKEAFVEKASSLTWVGEVDLDKGGGLLCGFTDYSGDFGDVDVLFFQFLFDLFFCGADVDSFDDQCFCKCVSLEWGSRFSC